MTDKRQAAKEKAELLAQQLEEGVQNVFNSEKWAEVLRMQGKFHKYSWGNVILIWSQRPDASRVAGYGTWQKLNRQVRKGEKGMKIMAPMRVTVEDEATGDRRSKIIGFTTATVFDVSQTDGDPLPDFANRMETSSEIGAQIYQALRSIITIPVVEEKITSGAAGYYVIAPAGEGSIALDSRLAMDAKAKTLAHEYVHSIQHNRDAETSKVPRDHAEAVAEGAAYVICSRFGLDTSSYSFEYVASWAGKIDLVRAVLQEIQQVSSKVIEQIEKAMGEDTGDQAEAA